jgi:hypothetical protein
MQRVLETVNGVFSLDGSVLIKLTADEPQSHSSLYAANGNGMNQNDSPKLQRKPWQAHDVELHVIEV